MYIYIYIYGSVPIIIDTPGGPCNFRAPRLLRQIKAPLGPGPGPRARGPGPGARGPTPGAQGPGPGAQGPGPGAQGLGPPAQGPGPRAQVPGPRDWGLRHGPGARGPGRELGLFTIVGPFVFDTLSHQH